LICGVANHDGRFTLNSGRWTDMMMTGRCRPFTKTSSYDQAIINHADEKGSTVRFHN
jgi:hypothetical protein